MYILFALDYENEIRERHRYLAFVVKRVFRKMLFLILFIHNIRDNYLKSNALSKWVKIFEFYQF